MFEEHRMNECNEGRAVENTIAHSIEMNARIV